MTDHTTKPVSQSRKALHLAASCVQDEIDSAFKISNMDKAEVLSMLMSLKRNILDIQPDQYADDCAGEDND